MKWDETDSSWDQFRKTVFVFCGPLVSLIVSRRVRRSQCDRSVCTVSSLGHWQSMDAEQNTVNLARKKGGANRESDVARQGRSVKIECSGTTHGKVADRRNHSLRPRGPSTDQICDRGAQGQKTSFHAFFRGYWSIGMIRRGQSHAGTMAYFCFRHFASLA